MNDFEDRIKHLMRDKALAEKKDIIKNIGFADYLQLLEASVDLGANATRSTTAATTPTGAKSKIPTPPPGEPALTAQGQLDPAKLKTGDQIAYKGLDNAINDVTVTNKFGNEYEVQAADGRKVRVPYKDLSARDSIFPSTRKGVVGQTVDAVKGIKNSFRKGYATGQKLTSSEEHDELNRLRELAGIEETCSAGATGAGAIASAPSIVGNTAHTPTDQLRARLRRKKEKKK